MTLPSYDKNRGYNIQKIIYHDQNLPELRIKIRNWYEGSIPLLGAHALYTNVGESAWCYTKDNVRGPAKEWRYVFKGEFGK